MRLIDQVFERDNLDLAYTGVLSAMAKGRALSSVRQSKRIARLEASRQEILSVLQEEYARDATGSFARRVTKIPKKPGGNPERPISVFAFRQRVVLRATLVVLWPHLEKAIEPSVSYCTFRMKGGLHPPRGIAAAVTLIAEKRRTECPHVFESDIRSFFDEIDREILVSQARSLLPDESLNDLLHGVVHAETQFDDRFEWDGSALLDRGVPQGAALSPLLACVYLSPFDSCMQERGLQMLRYVDDLVVLGSERQCHEAEAFAGQILADRFGLKLHPDPAKTRQVGPTEPLTFLGHSISALGILKPSPKRKNAVRERVLRTVCGLPRARQNDVAQELTSYLLGYFHSSATVTGNSPTTQRSLST